MTPALALTPVDRSPADALAFPRGQDRSGRSDFASVLGRMTRTTGESDEQLARRSAENFVSMTLVQPLLKSLRASSNAAPPFAPTDGEKQFQGLMDAELAERIVRTSNFKVVDRIASDILERSRRAAGGTDASGASSSSADDGGEHA